MKVGDWAVLNEYGTLLKAVKITKLSDKRLYFTGLGRERYVRRDNAIVFTGPADACERLLEQLKTIKAQRSKEEIDAGRRYQKRWEEIVTAAIGVQNARANNTEAVGT